MTKSLIGQWSEPLQSRISDLVNHLISSQKQETRNRSSLSEIASVPLLLLFQVNIPNPGFTSIIFREPILSLSILEEGPNQAISPLFSSKLVIALKSLATIQGRNRSKDQTNLICDHIRDLPTKSLGAYILENKHLSPVSK